MKRHHVTQPYPLFHPSTPRPVARSTLCPLPPILNEPSWCRRTDLLQSRPTHLPLVALGAGAHHLNCDGSLPMNSLPASRVVYRLGYLLVAVTALGTTGCADDLVAMRPAFLDRFFPEPYDATTGAIVKPSERIDELRQIGETASSKSPAEQQQISAALAGQIQREQDPLIRREIVKALANLNSPVAGAVAAAGLKDPDRDVRITCCRTIAERRGPQATVQLSEVLDRDNSADVRIAAVRGLGTLGDAAALPSLVTALESRDPAVQYAAIDATRAIRTAQGGSDLGTDVNAWLAYAQGQTPRPTQPDSTGPVQWAKRLVPGWN